MVNTLIIGILCLLTGVAVGYLAGKSLSVKSNLRINEMNVLIREKEESFKVISEEKEKNYREKLENVENSKAKEIKSLRDHYEDLIKEMEKRHNESLESLKNQFKEISGTLSEQLKNTTEDMLKRRQEEFSQSSGQQIGQLLEPLKLSLKTMQEKVSENTARHTELGGQLSESIKNLLDHTESAQASADKLSEMLKGNSRQQGEWGERILKEILESLNLKEGIHFHTQQILKDEKGYRAQSEDGSFLKPDVILHIDQNKDVIIDSKVSLTAYMKYQEAENDLQRQEALKEHIASLERHVNELAKKDYSSYVAHPRVRMGYVIMFVPNTSALMLATTSKSTLWREAMEKNVYIADEQTLYAALKIVSLTWRQIAQNENHKEVFKLAEEMLKRVATFMKHFTDIGKNLDNASKSYKEGLKKLEEGGQSIPKTCRNLIDLGAKAPALPKGVEPELLGLSELIDNEIER
ncbi:MAG: DNA recombination protein RmuC [Muribaculaceae bacterium]|nr:DNA recombination protein RmuC [Muribaculaceae bacterium]